MKKTDFEAIEAYGFYYLRTATLPISSLFSLNKTLLENQKLSNDILLKHFRIQFDNSELFKSAIHLGSHDLFTQFVNFDSQVAVDKSNKVLLSLYKYYIRMCSRTTPYNLFSASSLGNISEKKNKIIRKDISIFNCYLDLDNGVNDKIKTKILNFNSLIKEIKFYRNNTIYELENSEIRYIKFENENDIERHYICTVPNNYYLDKIINWASSGISFSKAYNRIAEEESIDYDDFFRFFKELVTEGLLIPEITPLVTKNSFLKDLLNKDYLKLEPILYEKISKIDNLLKQKGRLFDRITVLEQEVASLLNTDQFLGRSLQANVVFESLSNTISINQINTLKKDLIKLSSLLTQVMSPHLENFKKEFKSKFDSCEVPILKVIDLDVGVGYGLLNRNNLPYSTSETSLFSEINESVEPVFYFSKFHKLKLDLLLKAKEAKEGIINLTDEFLEEVKKINDKKVKFPRQFCVSGSFHKDNESEKFNLDYLNGPNAFRNFSRFCWGDTTLMENLLQNREEFFDDFIFAEIVHSPYIQDLNIISRPATASYIIPIHNNSNFINDKTISLSDIYVSVIDNRVYLRSKRLNKYIIPILNVAHNYSTRNISIYKFLCDIQNDYEHVELFWDWGSVLSDSFDFCPRIVYNSLILSKAQWNIKLGDFLKTSENKNNYDYDSFLGKIVSKHKIPSIVCLKAVDGDDMVVDLRLKICRDILIKELKRYGKIILSEYLNNDCTEDSNQNEVVSKFFIPFRNMDSNLKDIGAPKDYPSSQNLSVERELEIGSNCLFFKIYSSSSVANNFLINILSPYIKKLKESGLVEKWFFIRYDDPNIHLRIRLFSNRAEDLWAIFFSELENLIQKSFLKEKIQNISVANYKRELERYGGDSIIEIESIFDIDSEYNIELLKIMNSEKLIQIGFLSLFYWLNIVFQESQSRLDFSVLMRDSYINEFRNKKQIKVFLDRKYKDNRSILDDIIVNKNNQFSVEHNILERRNAQISTLLEQVLLTGDYQRNWNKKMLLISSLIHMSINRLFSYEPRKGELMLYHFVYKYFTMKKYNSND